MQWLTEGHKSSVSPPGLPGAPAALGAWHHPSGSSGVTPHQTRHLQQGWLRLGMRILEGDLEYQEEILLSLFSLNVCLLDSGQCPKGVCCPWVCYLQKERTFSQPEQGTSPSHIHLSVCQPLNLWEMPFICSQAQWWIPAALRGQGAERKEKGTIRLSSAEIHKHSSKTCSGASILCGHKLGCLQSDLSSSGGHQGWKRG